MYATAIMAGSLALASAWAGWTIQGIRMSEQIAQIQTEYATQQAKAVERAHAETIRLQAQADEASRKHAARSAALAHDVDSARSAVERLRVQLAATTTADNKAMPSDSSTAPNPYTTADSELLIDCAGRYQRVSEKADGHAADALMLLQAWPRSAEIESQ